MYTPKHFSVTDKNEIIDFIEKNSFGTIVTTDQGRPTATQLPFLFHQVGDELYVTSHFAYANNQWKTFEESESVLVIFQGPHTYVSSSWYHHENVPTWNYQTVHVYGTASLLNEVELEEDLTLLLQKYETDRKRPVLWGTLSDETKKQMKGIVGFKVKIEEINAQYKLSQNRNETDYENIIGKLKKEIDPAAKQVAEQMEKLKKNE